MPIGTRVVADRSLRRDGARFTGGSPLRLLRFSAAGWRIAQRLLDGRPVTNEREGFVARQLLDAGHAHPLADGPPALDVTAVIPVRDRPAALARCLDALRIHAVVVDDGSRDPAEVARVCARPGVSLLRCEVSSGPGAARNRGLAAVTTPAVLFVDSDVVTSPGMVRRLGAHLHDPRVAAAAPRIRPAPAGRTALARHLAARSPLDLGPYPAQVRPSGTVSYVPTACLLARVAALPAFDAALRYGEDVDLVWRLVASGGQVRYDPSATALHTEPSTWRATLARRYRYGTSAGPLALRHPGSRLAPYRAAPLPAAGAVAVLLLPTPAAGAGAAAVVLAVAARLLRARVPRRVATRYAVGAVLHSAAALGRYASGVGAPAALGVVAGSRRRRRVLGRLVLLTLLAQRTDARGARTLDPVRAAIATALDETAYAAGVWRGALAARTADPLVPRFR